MASDEEMEGEERLRVLQFFPFQSHRE